MALVVLGVLFASGDSTTLPPPRDTPVDRLATAWLGPKPWPDARLARAASLAAQSKAWLEGRRRYLESVVLADGFDRALPPAGQATDPPFHGPVGILELRGPDLPSGIVLDVQPFEAHDPTDRIVTVQALPGRTAPLWIPGATVRVRLRKPGLFLGLGGELSDWHLYGIPAAGDLPEWTFPEAEGWTGVVRVAPRWDSSGAATPVSSTIEPAKIEGSMVAALWPVRLLLPPTVPREEVLTIDPPGEGSTLRILEVKGDRRYTAACLWSETGTLPRVRARRGDTGAFVGLTSPDVPLFVAVADRWSSIVLDVLNDPSEARGALRLLASSESDDPGAKLFVEMLGHALPRIRAHGDSASRDAQLRAARWLRQALGVEWTDVELDELRPVDGELAGILEQIAGRAAR